MVTILSPQFLGADVLPWVPLLLPNWFLLWACGVERGV